MARKTTLTWMVLAAGLIVLAGCGQGAAPAEAPQAPAAEEVAAEPTEPAAEEVAAEPAAEEAAPDTAQSAEAAPAGPLTFVIVPEESKASYIVDEEFLADALSKLGIEAGQNVIEGSTQEIEGELQVDPSSATFSGGTIRVNLPSLATDQSRRDKWIRENALESNKYPVAEFVAKSVEGAPASYTEGEEVSFQLLGDLTVRETTLPITFDVTATVEDGTLTGVAVTDALISDFGFEPPSFANTLTVADPFQIKIVLTARAQ